MSALREILAKFGVEFDQSGIQKGHQQVDGMIAKLEHLGHSVAVAFGIHEVKEWFEGIFEGARALDIQAQTLGMSAEALQSWKYAAHLADVNADMFAERLNRLQMSLFRASKGSGAASQELTEMGVEFKAAGGGVKSVEEVLLSLADAVQATDDMVKKKALIQQLFGRGSARLVNIFSKGRAGVQELREEFQKLGGGYDEEFLKQSEEVEDAQKRVHYVTQALSISLASKLLPLVEKGAHFIEGLVRRLTELQKQGAVTNAVVAFLGASMLVKLPLIIGYVKKLASMVSLPTVMFAALVLLVDDLITTFQGGESVTRDFLDGMFGDGTTERIVGNIRTISSEVGGLLSNFQTQSKTASDTALAILAVIQSIGLVFSAAFGAINAAARITWRLLGDLQALLGDIAIGAQKVMKFMGLYGGEISQSKGYSTSADYGSDLDKGLGGSADRIDAIVKTFQAMGNQQTPGGITGQALAAAGEVRPDVAAFLAQEQARPNIKTEVHQVNNFTMAPGSTKEQARQVAGAVDEANKSSYRAAQANLEHRVE